MGKLVELVQEEPEENFRADMEEIREMAWQRYMDLCEDADALGLSFGGMIRQILLCRMTDRF